MSAQGFIPFWTAVERAIAHCAANLDGETPSAQNEPPSRASELISPLCSDAQTFEERENNG